MRFSEYIEKEHRERIRKESEPKPKPGGYEEPLMAVLFVLFVLFYAFAAYMVATHEPGPDTRAPEYKRIDP